MFSAACCPKSTTRPWSIFTPASIAGLQLWLPASSIPGNDGDAVGTWTDQSGQGHSAIQPTSAFKPTLKKNIVNGNAVVRFLGSSNQNMPITYAQARPQTLFMVYQVDVANIGRTIAGTTTVGANNWLFGAHATGPRWWFANGAVGTASGSTGIFYCLSGVGTVSDSTLYSNGVSLANSAAVGVWGATLSLGGASGSESFTGDIAELVTYDTALSDANRILVQNYLMTKYALT